MIGVDFELVLHLDFAASLKIKADLKLITETAQLAVECAVARVSDAASSGRLCLPRAALVWLLVCV